MLLVVGMARAVRAREGLGLPCADHTLLRCAKAELPAVAAEKLERVRMIVHIELAAIVLILLCPAITAKGGWV